MTSSSARPGALLRPPTLRHEARPRLGARLRDSAAGACVVLLGLLVALVLAAGGVPSVASVTSRPSVGPSGSYADAGAEPLVVGAADASGADSWSLR